MRIIHLSDIHLWRLTFNPIRLLGKRSVGMFELLGGRARRFRLERLADVVERVVSLRPDHVLITGDLTTTSLPAEFADAREALAPLLTDPSHTTILPGNHDRYTRDSVRQRSFEATFGEFAPVGSYPWLKHLDPQTAVLGLDPTRAHLSARGLLRIDQLARARHLVADPTTRPRRLIVACHYPTIAPERHQRHLAGKGMVNADAAREWLATIGPHLYCCGHIHAAWAFTPAEIPQELSLNSGAPLLRDLTGELPPGFLQIDLEGDDVSVIHESWGGERWATRSMIAKVGFFTRP